VPGVERLEIQELSKNFHDQEWGGKLSMEKYKPSDNWHEFLPGYRAGQNQR
jgi:hypothetical protein